MRSKYEAQAISDAQDSFVQAVTGPRNHTYGIIFCSTVPSAKIFEAASVVVISGKVRKNTLPENPKLFRRCPNTEHWGHLLGWLKTMSLLNRFTLFDGDRNIKLEHIHDYRA